MTQAALVPAIITPYEHQPQSEQHTQGTASESSAPYRAPMVVYSQPQHTEYWVHNVSFMLWFPNTHSKRGEP